MRNMLIQLRLMFILLAITAIIGMCITANANEAVYKQKPIQCATPDKILNHYVELYDFNATFVAVSSVRNQYGSDQLAGIVFFMNPETGTYLILEGNAQYACVLSVGNNLDFDITHEEIMGILLGGGT